MGMGSGLNRGYIGELVQRRPDVHQWDGQGDVGTQGRGGYVTRAPGVKGRHDAQKQPPPPRA
jgi:hypothetical protein